MTKFPASLSIEEKRHKGGHDMPLSNLAKKAMAFAVTILCSLASIGVGGPAKPKETPPTMHDSLYDSWVATAYNALPMTQTSNHASTDSMPLCISAT